MPLVLGDKSSLQKPQKLFFLEREGFPKPISNVNMPKFTETWGEISALRQEGASQTKVLWCHVPTMDFSKFIKKVMFAEQRIVGVGLHRIIVSCQPAPAGGPA